MSEAQPLLKVFLCHASQDKLVVRELFHRFKAEGWIDPWLDEKKLLPGQDWRLEIEKAVETSDIVVICLSNISVSKEGYVQKEFRYARDIALEKPEGMIFIIPLRLEACEVPRGLRDYQWADYFGEKKSEYYDSLIAALRVRYEEKLIAQVKKEGWGANKLSKQEKEVPEAAEEIRISIPHPSNVSVSLVHRFPAPGRRAEGIAWDGNHLWLTDNSASIFEVDDSGETCEEYQSPEGTPQGITWDGSSFWVFTTNRSQIYRLQLGAGQRKIVGVFQAPAGVIGGGVTKDLAWDGNCLWFANQYKVHRLDISGRELNHLTFSWNIMGVACDGSDLWLAYRDASGSPFLRAVDPAKKTLATFPSPIFEIDGLAWADGYLWALGMDSPGGARTVYKLKTINP